jgi:hypothetical protein
MSELMAHTTMKPQNPLLNSLEQNQAIVHATTGSGQMMQIAP